MWHTQHEVDLEATTPARHASEVDFALRGPHIFALGLHLGPKKPQNGRRWPQDGLTLPQAGPKNPQDCSKMAPRWAHDGPKMAQDGCSAFGKLPKTLIFQCVFNVFKGSLRPCLTILGPILGPSWAMFGPSWAILGSSWAILGPSWGHLGGSCGYLGAMLGHPGSILGLLRAKLPAKSKNIDLFQVFTDFNRFSSFFAPLLAHGRA